MINPDTTIYDPATALCNIMCVFVHSNEHIHKIMHKYMHNLPEELYSGKEDTRQMQSLLMPVTIHCNCMQVQVK